MPETALTAFSSSALFVHLPLTSLIHQLILEWYSLESRCLKSKNCFYMYKGRNITINFQKYILCRKLRTLRKYCRGYDKVSIAFLTVSPREIFRTHKYLKKSDEIFGLFISLIQLVLRVTSIQRKRKLLFALNGNGNGIDQWTRTYTLTFETAR